MSSAALNASHTLPDPRRPEEANAPQPSGEDELDLDTEWDTDWPGDDDGDWSGCQQDGWEPEPLVE